MSMRNIARGKRNDERANGTISNREIRAGLCSTRAYVARASEASRGDKRYTQSRRYEANDMNVYRSGLSACVITVLPNVYDYIHKHRERLMELKRQKQLQVLDTQRTQQPAQQQQQQQLNQTSRNNPFQLVLTSNPQQLQYQRRQPRQ